MQLLFFPFTYLVTPPDRLFYPIPYPTPSPIPSSRLATSRLRRLLTYTLSAPTARSPRIVRRQISSAVAPPANSRVISAAGTGK